MENFFNKLGVGFKHLLFSQQTLGKCSNLTSIFSGWFNHQLGSCYVTLLTFLVTSIVEDGHSQNSRDVFSYASPLKKPWGFCFRHQVSLMTEEEEALHATSKKNLVVVGDKGE